MRRGIWGRVERVVGQVEVSGVIMGCSLLAWVEEGGRERRAMAWIVEM